MAFRKSLLHVDARAKTKAQGAMKKYSAKDLHPDAADRNHAAYKEGCRLFAEGLFKKARSAFDEALEYWPGDPQAWMALGNCFDELKNPSSAEACFLCALDHCRPAMRGDVLFNLGNSLFDQQRYVAAILRYEEIDKEATIWQKARRNLRLARAAIVARTCDSARGKNRTPLVKRRTRRRSTN